MKTGFALLAALAGLLAVASPNGLVVSAGLLTFLAGIAVVCRELARSLPPGCGDDPGAGRGRRSAGARVIHFHPRTAHLVLGAGEEPSREGGCQATPNAATTPSVLESTAGPGLHISRPQLSAPADVNAVEPGVPAPSSLRRPGGAGTTNGSES